MYLFELFSDPAHYSLEHHEGNEMMYEFEVDNIRYQANATIDRIDNIKDFADTQEIGGEQEYMKADKWFTDRDGKPRGRDVMTYEFAEIGQGDDVGQSLHHSTGHAGSSAMKVFATVMAIFEDIKQGLAKGTLVVVSAKSSESSRVNLYKKFAQKYGATQINGIREVVFVMEV